MAAGPAPKPEPLSRLLGLSEHSLPFFHPNSPLTHTDTILLCFFLFEQLFSSLSLSPSTCLHAIRTRLFLFVCFLNILKCTCSQIFGHIFFLCMGWQLCEAPCDLGEVGQTQQCKQWLQNDSMYRPFFLFCFVTYSLFITIVTILLHSTVFQQHDELQVRSHDFFYLKQKKKMIEKKYKLLNCTMNC